MGGINFKNNGLTDTQTKKRMNKKSRIVIIILVILLIISSIIYILKYEDKENKYYSMNDIQKEWDPREYKDYQNKEFKAGDIIHLKDKITGKVLYNSTYGPITGLCFNNIVDIRLLFFENKYNDYQIGEMINQDLHFNYWYYNGIKYLWIDEIIPALILNLNIMIRGVSNVAGMTFNPNCQLFEYEHTLNIDTYRASFDYSLMNISFSQGSEIFHGEMNNPREPYLDIIDPLYPGLSKNGYFSFEDKNHDGNLSTKDKFIIKKIEPTVNKYTVDTYILNVKGMIGGEHMIINWDKGIFDFSLFTSQKEYSLETEVYPFEDPKIEFLYNSITDAIFKIDYIDEKMVESLTYSTLEWGEYWVKYLYNPNNNLFYPSGEFRPDEYDFNKDSIFIYKDENSNDKLDNGDIFIIEKTEPGIHYSLKFFDKEWEQLFIRFWYPGIISNYGNYPLFTFNTTIEFDNMSKSYNITIDTIIGLQGEDFFDMDFYLFENGEEITRLNRNSNYQPDYSYFINNDTFEIFHYDLDGNKRVTIGDTFSIKNSKSGFKYQLEIYYNSYFCGYYEWVTDF